MDIDIEQLRRGIRVAAVFDAADVCEPLPDGVRISDRCDEFVLRVQDGERRPAVHPVAEIAEAMERAHNERRRQALRDLDAAHKAAKKQLRCERKHIAELEKQLRCERKRIAELEEQLKDEQKYSRNLVMNVEGLHKSLQNSEQLAEAFRSARDHFRDRVKELERNADAEACARRADKLERALERERARSEELRARHADELERALNMALTGAWQAAKCALRDAGWPVRHDG